MSTIADRGADGGQLADLLEELGSKNHVRVVKYAAVRPDPKGRLIHRKVLDELGDAPVPQLPALVLHDSLRMLAGRKPIYLDEAVRRMGGDLRSVTANLRTTVGTDYTANALGSTSQPTNADTIGLSGNTGTPATGDTSASVPWSTAQATDVTTPTGAQGEWTALGMARQAATYNHSNGVASYTLSATWTASATVTGTRMAGLFGGSTKGTRGSSATTNILYLANTFTATTLATNDQLSLTWTVNV